MSQSLLYHAFGVREATIMSHQIPSWGYRIHLGCEKGIADCPTCQSENVVRKGQRYRHIQTVPIGFKSVTLKTEVPQCECKACGKTFEVSPPLPSRM